MGCFCWIVCVQDSLPEDFRKEIESIDYSSGVTKINGKSLQIKAYQSVLTLVCVYILFLSQVALSGLPNFTAVPNESANPAPHHRATIHLGCESLQSIHDAYLDGANRKIPSQRCVYHQSGPIYGHDSTHPTYHSPPTHHALLLICSMILSPCLLYHSLYLSSVDVGPLLK